MRSVTLVCGPPCAGKSTYVTERAQPGDVILDFDVIAQELGSPRQWQHDAHYGRLASQVWKGRVAELAARSEVRAWVIRCAPTWRERFSLTQLVRATEVVVLAPDRATLTARAHQRPQPSVTLEAIDKWYREYTAGPVTARTRTWGERKRRAAVVKRWRDTHGDLCPGYEVPPHPSGDLTADHITPVATGGDEDGELQVLCRPCNSRKRDGRRRQPVRRSLDW